MTEIDTRQERERETEKGTYVHREIESDMRTER